MPVTKQAKKKLKQDKKREKDNSSLERLLKKAVKNATLKKLPDTFTIIDKAAKKNIIHQNKASRIKSRLSKKLAPQKAVKQS
jgi:small subunit ribosomal protein S20